MRFSFSRDQGLGIFVTGYPKSETIPCNSTAPVDSIEVTVSGTSTDSPTMPALTATSKV
jgi:hypothetical protein